MDITHRQAVLLLQTMRQALEMATLAAHGDGLELEQSVRLISVTSRLRDAYSEVWRDILREHPLLIGDVESAGLEVAEEDRQRAEAADLAWQRTCDELLPVEDVPDFCGYQYSRF